MDKLLVRVFFLLLLCDFLCHFLHHVLCIFENYHLIVILGFITQIRTEDISHQFIYSSKLCHSILFHFVSYFYLIFFWNYPSSVCNETLCIIERKQHKMRTNDKFNICWFFFSQFCLNKLSYEYSDRMR